MKVLLTGNKHFSGAGPAKIEYKPPEGGPTTVFDLLTQSAATDFEIKNCVRVFNEHGEEIGLCAAVEDLFDAKYTASNKTLIRGVAELLKDCRDCVFLINRYNIKKSEEARLVKRIDSFEKKKPKKV